MRSIFTLMAGVAFVALVAVGCSSSNTASTPAKGTAGAKSGDATTDQKSADGSKPGDTAAAGTDQKDVTPLVDAAKSKEGEANSVTIKAVDQATGQVVNLVFKTIHFDYDKYTIRPEDQPAIEHNAGLLSKESNLKVIVEGHCDERGTTEYNLALGEHRAVAVMKAMDAAGAKKKQIKTVSYGKERPLDPGHTEDAWAKNRRSIVRSASAS